MWEFGQFCVIIITSTILCHAGQTEHDPTTTMSYSPPDYTRDQHSMYYQGNRAAPGQYEYQPSRRDYHRSDYSTGKGQFQPSPAVLDLEQDVLESAQVVKSRFWQQGAAHLGRVIKKLEAP